MPTTKEQLVYYLLHNISLGTYDKKFLNNILTSKKDGKTVVTSNQAELMNKITLRYSRQLRRKEIDANDMVKLSWETEPLESSPEFTDAFITIKDDVVELRTPYRKEFINDLRTKSDHLNIVWHKEVKRWTAPLCEDVLKLFINCVEKHFYMIHYCPETVAIIESFSEYESAKYWDPTLVRINGNLYIIATNGSLDTAIGNLVLDTSLSTLAKLVCYGIKISNELIAEIEGSLKCEDPLKQIDFATSLNPVLDSSDPNILLQHLINVGCDYVLITESFGTMRKNIPTLMKLLDENNIPYLHLDKRSEVTSVDFTPYEMPILVNTGLWATPAQNKLRLGASKSVFLGNNNPIQIK